MATAIRKLFLGHAADCVICNKYSYCQHHDDELRGDVCFSCIQFLSVAETFLRSLGHKTATAWDEK